MRTRVVATAALAFVLLSIGALVACKKSEGAATGAASRRRRPAEQRVEKNPDRNAYFGEEHIHTSWSVDAWLMGNRLTGPDEAYKYAQGQTIKHPLGYDIKIDTPMDFMGVTDHSEYVGVTKEANTPGSALSKLPEAQPLILKDPNNQADIQKVFTYLVNMLSKPPVKALMSPEVAGSIWSENVKIADRTTIPESSPLFVLMNTRPKTTTSICTAMSFSVIAPTCRHCRTVRWTPGTPRTCGSGWTRSARRATSCLQSRTMPT